ncbi:MAG: undecaprenyldiphospho-muramoylpentapeptide beta-N-acetylglucosaminyltransferase [Candidatus Rifleibacteriota bacterium]
MRIIFSGGGTGGHIYPALAIRGAIIEDSRQIIETAYVGIKNGMEEKLVSRVENLSFMPVRAQGMPRKPSWKWLSFPYINFMGVADAIRHLRSFKPDLVVTTGGFVAFPTLAAAKLLGIPYVIHEQNASMGLTNRLFAAGACRVFLTYESAAPVDNKRIFLTGNPVRKAFFADGSKGTRFKKNDNEFWILAVGGSRGALSINKMCVDLVKHGLKEIQGCKLLHISGERDYEMVKSEVSQAQENYLLLSYLHEMKEAFAVADIIISRAGATMLSEIAVCGKPAILVPYPYATDNHQEKNARALQKLGAAEVILDSELSSDAVIKILKNLKDSDKLATMSRAMKKSRPVGVEKSISQKILEVC